MLSCFPCGVVTPLLFSLRNDTCMGNPSGPAGHLPYKAEEFCLRTDKLFVATEFKPVAAEPGTVSDETRSGRMSPRRWNKFLFAGFFRISVTRILRLQGKTEKKAGNFCTKQPLCAMFHGGFLLFEAVRSRNFAAGTKKSEPRKRKSRLRNFFFEPQNFFPRPRFFQTAAWNPFFPLFGTFSPTNPRCQYVGTSPVRLTRPGNPGAETARTRGKKKACSPYLPTFGFPHVPRDCVFCARPRPLPRTSESQGPSNDKVSNPRANSKMSNPSQRISREA